jgi:hypothetical protein
MVGLRELESLTSCVSTIRVSYSPSLTVDEWCSKYRVTTLRLVTLSATKTLLESVVDRVLPYIFPYISAHKTHFVNRVGSRLGAMPLRIAEPLDCVGHSLSNSVRAIVTYTNGRPAGSRIVTQAVRTSSAYNVSEMKIELDEDERTLFVRALEQYHAYLVSQQREDRRYSDLANWIKASDRETRKPPRSESSKDSRVRARR